MSFMAAAGAIGLTGLGATIGAGAMMGATMGGVSNLVQGRGVFDNIGQNLLVGGAGAGIVSGLGSALGGQTVAELSGPAAQAELAAAGQTAGNAGLKASEAAMTAANTNTLATNSLVDQATLNPDALMSGDKYRDFLNQTTYRPPDFAANQFSPEGIAYQQSQGALPADIAQQAGENAANSSKFPGYSQATKDLMKPASFMKNPADYMVQNPTTVAGMVSGVASLFNKPAPPVGLQDKTGYSPQYTYDPKTQKYIAAAPMSYTYKGAEGGEVPGFAEGVYIPQSKDIHTNIYGSNAGPIGTSGKQMFKNTDKYAVLQEQMDKMSPSMLSRLSKSGTDPIIQAAATTELYDRVSHPNPAYIDQTPMQAAQGGIIGMAMGGYTSSAFSTAPAAAPRYNYNPADQSYTENPQAQIGSGAMSGLFGDGFSQEAMQSLFGGQSSAPVQYSFDPNGQNFTKKMAMGGIASLPNEYAAGGKLLQGPGDGMSDSIPAVIKGDRPQRAALAQGEFVVPADVVSHLGNGSTDAGAKRLYAMMDKIRHARTGNKKQGKQINPANFLPA